MIWAAHVATHQGEGCVLDNGSHIQSTPKSLTIIQPIVIAARKGNYAMGLIMRSAVSPAQPCLIGFTVDRENVFQYTSSLTASISKNSRYGHLVSSTDKLHATLNSYPSWHDISPALQGGKGRWTFRQIN